MSIGVVELLDQIKKFLLRYYAEIDSIGENDAEKPSDIKELEKRWKKAKEELNSLIGRENVDNTLDEIKS